MIKSDGTSTRAGAVVNGATLVKDEQSDIWAVDDGKGVITVQLTQTHPFVLNYEDAGIVYELLQSLVQRDYAPYEVIAEVTEAKAHVSNG